MSSSRTVKNNNNSNNDKNIRYVENRLNKFDQNENNSIRSGEHNPNELKFKKKIKIIIGIKMKIRNLKMKIKKIMKKARNILMKEL